MRQCQVRVRDVSQEGEGIAKNEEGRVFFVPGTVPGDLLLLSYDERSRERAPSDCKILEPSAERIAAFCPYFGAPSNCGGCQAQELPYARLLEYKERQVRETLSRIGGIDPAAVRWENPAAMAEPYHYRNNVQLKIRPLYEGGFARGFFARSGHKLAAHENCGISQLSDHAVWEGLNAAMDELSGPAFDALREGWLELILRSGIRTGQIMLALNLNARARDLMGSEERFFVRALEEIRQRLPEDRRISSLWLLCADHPRDDLLVYGSPEIEEILCGKNFRIGPRSFFQVNSLQAEALYNTGKAFISEGGRPSTIYDLYCGIGSIGICLAEAESKVIGIEIFPEAVRSAQQNAERNGIRESAFLRGKAEQLFKKFEPEEDSLVIVDPPRKGLAPELCETLNACGAGRLLYISCHPGTLARDLARLSSWQPQRIRVIDMFPWTMHVETITVIQRKKS